MTRISSKPGTNSCCPKSAHRRYARRPGHLLAGLVAASTLSATAFAAGKVSIRFTGEIQSECALVNSAGSAAGPALNMPLELGDVTRPGERAFPFVVNCNTPFSYRLEAQYGALTHTAAATALGGLAASVPYDVAVHIPTDGAAIDDRCPGESLAAGRVRCPFSSSGNYIALGSDARLTVTWTPRARALLAGDYVERLTIRVAASL